MSVGAQGEAGIGVAKHTADRAYVNAVLKRHSGEGVTQGMETCVLQTERSEDLGMDGGDGVRVIHASGTAVSRSGAKRPVISAIPVC